MHQTDCLYYVTTNFFATDALSHSFKFDLSFQPFKLSLIMSTAVKIPLIFDKYAWVAEKNRLFSDFNEKL